MSIITKKISKISFGIQAPPQIKKLSAATVISPELYDADGYPIEKGLMDLAMGTIDPGLKCKTCGGRMRTCPGHFGSIQLSKPVLHIQYAPLVYNLLRSFCKECGRIYMSESAIEKYKQKVLDAKKENNIDLLDSLIKSIITKIKNAKKCPYCNEKAPKIKLDKPTTFHDGDKRLWPTEIRDRLEKIPDSDLEVIGFDTAVARPEWIVLTMILVPPITMRPSITLISGERSEDDLTHKLSDIVRVNQRLLENINAGAPEIIVEDLWDLLQYHITTYFNNEISQIPPARHKSNRPLKTLSQRLKGKEGRFRYNLAGKRVNFCARSVITPDPLISVDEIGVPSFIATELSVPERVTEWNIDWLKKFIKNCDKYPGANYVSTDEGKRKKITEDTAQQILDELAPGWVVERHLLNGDVVLFNRQPSLHRLSMMAFRVKLFPGRTFRMNPIVTTPFNADFDGDEMNIHLPQTEEARAEAKNLLILSEQVITPRYGLSIIGELQDALLGLYVLSEGTFFTQPQTSDILSAIGYDGELPKPTKKDLWSGRQIISLLLPKDLNFEKGGIKIKNGTFEAGYINEKAVGPEKGTLIHYMFKKYGAAFTRDLLNKLNILGLTTSKIFPYTLSFYDLDISPKTKKRIKDLIASGIDEVNDILKDYNKGKIVPIPGRTIEETTEARILYALNKVRNSVGDLIEKEAKDDNNLVLMTKVGLAKILNLALMAGFVGQQALRGERIGFGFTGRTLSHFKKGDLGPKARGFAEHGYNEGLDPQEMFFNAIVGRDSLMDTAMRTPKSGYMQRRLINALQDLKVTYDGTVRDASNKIVEFKFGGDNIDVAKSDHGGIDTDVL
jgi:DNA-directed RNA polymerase subunit A'